MTWVAEKETYCVGCEKTAREGSTDKTPTTSITSFNFTSDNESYSYI